MLTTCATCDRDGYMAELDSIMTPAEADRIECDRDDDPRGWISEAEDILGVDETMCRCCQQAAAADAAIDRARSDA